MKFNHEHEQILNLLNTRAALKQDIADFSEEALQKFKKAVEVELMELSKHITDTRIRLRHEDKGKHEFRVFIGSDVLVFQLHSNIFRLPDEHQLWSTKYLKQNESNGYFALINVYNFLAESFEQNRSNDLGYLLGRIYINREKLFMVEGEGKLGEIYKSISKAQLTDQNIHHILRCFISYAIEFDLIAPPYDVIQEISLQQIQSISSDLQVATGKRLGFRFSAEDKDFF